MTGFTLRFLPLILPAPLVLLFFLPGPLESQVVRGRLVDDLTGDPIPTANVRLLRGERGNSIVSRTITSGVGEFLLAAEGTGRVRLRADGMGYKEVVSPPFDLVGSDTLDVELRMAVEAVPLAPLTVVTERSPLLLTRSYEIHGFAERRETYGPNGLRLGTFLERKDWEHRSPTLMADLLRGVSGVRVHRGEVRMRITGFDPAGCRPEYYLDGQHVRMLEEVTFPEPNKRVIFRDQIDDLISPASIAAVEVYHGMGKPAQFMDMGNSPCGAIVIWSGQGGELVPTT